MSRIKLGYGLIFQLILLALVAVLFKVWDGSWLSFTSAWLGGGAWLVPSRFFLWQVRNLKSVTNRYRLAIKFFIFELLKLLISFGLIVLFLRTIPIKLVSFFIGYLVIVISSFPLTFFYLKKDG